jgi:hypothetical protein
VVRGSLIKRQAVRHKRSAARRSRRSSWLEQQLIRGLREAVAIARGEVELVEVRPGVFRVKDDEDG